MYTILNFIGSSFQKSSRHPSRGMKRHYLIQLVLCDLSRGLKNCSNYKGFYSGGTTQFIRIR